MKVSELTGVQLDYWVARAEGYASVEAIPSEVTGSEYHPHEPDCELKFEWSPSTDWTQGGPMIERERITIDHVDNFSGSWRAGIVIWLPDHDDWIYGPTPLIAAMRAYVASKFGGEVPDQEPK